MARPSAGPPGSLTSSELPEELALALRELRGHDDVDDHVQVATSRAAQPRHALAAKADLVAGLDAGGDGDLLGPLDGRNRQRRAEGRLRERDRQLVEQLGAAAHELRVVANLDRHVEVAVRAAARARLTLALDRDPLAIVDARGNRDLEASLLAHAPVAAAQRARAWR